MTAATLPFEPASVGAAPVRRSYPAVGIAAVMLGAVTSTLYGRVTTFGLADIRGAVHAGIDEGAWITTAATVGQMLMGVLAVWLGPAFGPRRVLFWGTAVFGLASLLIPFAPDLPTIVALQFLGGLGSGTFVPLAIAFVMRNLKPDLQVFGIAAYAMSLELSQNVPASLEGFYLDHEGWAWIFWQNAVLAPVMLILIGFGIPRDPVNRDLVARVDAPGMIYLAGGSALAYAALDQGDRLDWFGSGLIVGLALGAAVLLACFVWRELTASAPFFDFRAVARVSNLPKLALILVGYRFLVLATALVVPQFLTIVQGYRALDVGDALIWIALPQFLLAPMIALTLRRVDPRLTMGVGFAAIGAACLLVAGGLTRDWVSANFVPSQLLQALGQSFALTSFAWFATRHLVPDQAITFGAFIQTFRLLGGELGVAFMTWFVRSSEQTNSNLLGLHIATGDRLTQARLAATAAGLEARALSPADAGAKAAGLLGRVVQGQAYVLAFVDALTLVALVAVACLVLVAWLKPAPSHPAPPQGAAA